MAHETLIDTVNANAAEVKESIYNSFNCHLKTIRAREQWLIDQVDNIRLVTIRSICETSILSETLGVKAQQCDQILKELKEDHAIKEMEKCLEALRLNCDEAARNLEMFEMPNMQFEHDKFSLQREITNYGNIKSNEMSEKDSMSSEEVLSCVGDFTQSSHCGKQCCQPQKMFEIEDMDVTHLLGGKEEKILAECCQANEVCGGMDECLFEEHCCSNLPPEHVINLKAYFDELNLPTKMVEPTSTAFEIANHDTLTNEENGSQNYVANIQKIFNSLTGGETSVSDQMESDTSSVLHNSIHTSNIAAAFGKILLSETTTSTSTEFEVKTLTRHDNSDNPHVLQIYNIFNNLLQNNEKSSMSPKPFQPSKREHDSNVNPQDPLQFISTYVPSITKSEMDVIKSNHSLMNHSFMSDEKLQLVSSKAVDILYSSEKQDSCKDESCNHIEAITSVFTMLNDDEY